MEVKVFEIKVCVRPYKGITDIRLSDETLETLEKERGDGLWCSYGLWCSFCAEGDEVRLYGSEDDRRHGFFREEHRLFLVAPSLEQGIPEVFKYFREIS